MKVRLMKRILSEAQAGRAYTKVEFRDKFGKGEWNTKVWRALQELDLVGALFFDAEEKMIVDNVTLAVIESQEILEAAAKGVKDSDPDMFDSLSNAREILTCVLLRRKGE